MAHVTIPDQDTHVTYPVTSASSGPFNVPFAIFSKADLTVEVDGVALSQGAFSYTPTSSTTGGYQTGYITLGTPIADAEILIYRGILPVRTSDMGPGPKDRDADNTQWDKFQAQLQDIRRDLKRAMLGQFGDIFGRLPSKDDLANGVLGFDSNGDPIAADLINTDNTPAHSTWVPRLTSNISQTLPFIRPEWYGVVDYETDPVGDYTAKMLDACGAALAEGRVLDLGYKRYGLRQLNLPNDAGILHIRNGKIIDTAPLVSGRQTMYMPGGGSIRRLTLENLFFDRNGDTSTSVIHYNQAIRIVDIEEAWLLGVDVTGNDAGELIKLDTIDKLKLWVSAHDAGYVHSSQTDDTIEGVVIDGCTDVSGYVHIRRLGRTDQTSANRDRLSRGLTISNARRLDLSVNVSRVDQGVDISGNAPTLGTVRGTISYCATNGWKAANAQTGISTVGLVVTQCGLDGATIGGVDPSDGDWTTWSQNVMVSGMVIRNIGANGIWSGSTPSGVLVSRESALGSAPFFPRGVYVTGNLIFSDQGSSTFTASGATISLTQENGMPVQTGVRVRLTTSGTLPTGLATGTDYWLIEVPGTLTCKFASSYINAQDGVAITTTGAGSGAHTVTLQSDMHYKVCFTDISESTDYPNVAFNNPGSGYTVAENLNSAPPAQVIQEVAQTGQLQGFKNRLMNGSFLINQRAVGSNADDTYCLDRWYVLTQSNAVAASLVSNPEDGAPACIRLTQSNASAQRMGIAQIIESNNCRDLRGRRGCLSGRVRTSTGATVRYAILAWEGTGDAVTSDVVSNWTSTSFTAGGFFNSTTLSVVATGSVATTSNTWRSLDAIFGSFSGSMTNVIVVLWTDGTMAQNATLDFNRLQLEPDRKATAFEHRPHSVELSLCQRYYEVGSGSAGPAWSGNATLSESYRAPCTYRVTKRATPTVTLTSSGNLGFAATSGSVVATDVDGFTESRAANATDTGRLYSSSWKSDAEL